MKLKFDRNYQTFFIKNEKKIKNLDVQLIKQVLFAKILSTFQNDLIRIRVIIK